MVRPPKRNRPGNLVEPTTFAVFTPDDDPNREYKGVTGYVRLPDWTPPETWATFDGEAILDSFALKDYWPGWKKSAQAMPDRLMGMDQNLKTLKARSRKFLEDERGAIGVPGTITWCKFIYSPPCWVLNDHPYEGHRMLYDDEYRRLGGTEKIQGAAFGLAKPPGKPAIPPAINTWGD